VGLKCWGLHEPVSSKKRLGYCCVVWLGQRHAVGLLRFCSFRGRGCICGFSFCGGIARRPFAIILNLKVCFGATCVMCDTQLQLACRGHNAVPLVRVRVLIATLVRVTVRLYGLAQLLLLLKRGAGCAVAIWGWLCCWWTIALQQCKVLVNSAAAAGTAVTPGTGRLDVLHRTAAASLPGGSTWAL
jgi:hypothetical protein